MASAPTTKQSNNFKLVRIYERNIVIYSYEAGKKYKGFSVTFTGSDPISKMCFAAKQNLGIRNQTTDWLAANDYVIDVDSLIFRRGILVI